MSNQVPAAAAAAPHADASDDLSCPHCGYSLQGLGGDGDDSSPTGRCPECGLPFDRRTLSPSRLPWSHRRQIGRVRAYRRTLLLAIFRPWRIGAEIDRPVDLRDARLFRRITLWIAFIPLALCTATVTLGPNARLWSWDVYGFSEWGYLSIPAFTASTAGSLRWALGPLTCPVLIACVLLYLFAVTGAAGYFFHPRRLSTARQNRAVALSHYPCATAVLLVPAALWCAVHQVFPDQFDGLPGHAALALVFERIVPAAGGVVAWLGYVVVYRRATGAGFVRVALFGVALYAVAVVLYALIMVALPTAAAYAALLLRYAF